MGEKEMLLSALTATAQNISEEFPNLEERGEEDPGVTAEVTTHVVHTCLLLFMFVNV